MSLAQGGAWARSGRQLVDQPQQVERRERLGEKEVRAGGAGLGHRHGAGGIRKYCAQQALLVSRLNMKRDLHMFPYSSKNTMRLLKAFKFLWGRGKRD